MRLQKHGRNKGLVYRSDRVRGKPKKTYVGPFSDPTVQVLLHADELARATTDAADAAVEQDLDDYARLEPCIRLLATRLSRLVWRHRDRHRGGNVTDQGRHHLPGKESAMHKTENEQANISREDFNALAIDATYGDEGALEELRQVLRENPAIYRRLGDLSHHVQKALVELAVGDSVLAREAFDLKISELRQELSRGVCSLLEGIVVEQIISTWLDVQVQHLGFAKCTDKEMLLKRWEQRLDRSQKRHLAAVKALAEVQQIQRGDSSA